jgi:hypothetical protein
MSYGDNRGSVSAASSDGFLAPRQQHANDKTTQNPANATQKTEAIETITIMELLIAILGGEKAS